MINFLKERQLIIISIVIIVIILGLIFVTLRKIPERAKEAPVVQKGAFVAQPVIAEQGLKKVVGEIDIRNAFIKVAETVGPAVVSISTERTQKFKVDPFPFRRKGNPFRDEFFNRFFDDFFRDLPEEYERKQMGLGSGVIIDKEGYILTNEHVVNSADRIMVTLSDGRKYEGKVKGSDPASDLAVVQIDAKNLPAAALGNSDFVQTGEWVVAIGNPFGYIVDSPKPTVTVGVVSALHRSLPSKKRGYLDLIQTDAAINPGNSGGPLCDLEGSVIGINVAIFSTTGGYQGVGFAIPANSAKVIIGDLIKGKKIMYGWMGVVVQDLTEDLARYFGLPDTNGALLSQVIKNSPADKAGLKEGDIIRRLNEKEIKNTKDLVVTVSRIPVGKNAKVLVIRNKAKLTLAIEIGNVPSDKELAQLEGKPIIKEEEEAVTEESWRGIKAASITRDLARRLNIVDTEGVIIASVESGSPAYYAKLRQMDIIKRIGAKTIKTLEDYKEAIKSLRGDVLVYTSRGFTVVKEAK